MATTKVERRTASHETDDGHVAEVTVTVQVTTYSDGFVSEDELGIEWTWDEHLVSEGFLREKLGRDTVTKLLGSAEDTSYS